MATSVSFRLNSSLRSHDLSPSLYQFKYLQRTRSFRCYSSAKNSNQTPRPLKIAVTGVTEILRLFSSNKERLDNTKYTQRDEPSISGIDDVMVVLKSDYDNAYFVTGNYTPTIYAEECIFEDPTIKFRGRDLYSRNLKLLVPFFDRPSIVLQNIEKMSACNCIAIKQLPWMICGGHCSLSFHAQHEILELLDGYEFSNKLCSCDMETKIVRHAESWNVSALEAVAQIFTPSFGRNGE